MTMGLAQPGPRPNGPDPATRHWTHAEPTWHVHVAGSVRSLKIHRPRTERKGASPRRLPPDLGSNPPSDSHFRGGGANSDCRLSRRGLVVPARDLGLRAGHGQLRTPLPRPLLRRRILRRVRSRRGHRLRRHLPLPERRRPPPLRPVPAGDAPADGFGRLR
jgi:hypothetical protein